MSNLIKCKKTIKILSSLIVMSLVICIMSGSAYADPAENVKLKMNDPLKVIQEQDDCEVIKTKKDVTWMKLSNGDIAIYTKQQAVHGGIKYDVVEGSLSASIEITPDNAVYINDEKVEYNENITTVDLVTHDIDRTETIPYSGWSRWTTYPLYGKAGDYTRTLKIVNKGNIILKQVVEDLPVSLLLIAITGPLGVKTSIGVSFAFEVKKIYSGLNTKSLWYNETVKKHKKSNNAIQYKTTWINSNGKPISGNATQYAYCTFG